MLRVNKCEPRLTNSRLTKNRFTVISKKLQELGDNWNVRVNTVNAIDVETNKIKTYTLRVTNTEQSGTHYGLGSDN